MDVVLDGQPLEQGLGGDNLLEMLEDLFQRYVGNDRTIGELIINGDPYQDDVHGSPEAILRSSIQSLDIQTLSAREVAMHFLTTAAESTGAIGMAAKEVADVFRAGDDRSANEDYLELLESLQLFLSMMQRCREVLGLDFNQIAFEGASASDKLSNLQGLTGEMLGAQEKQDWVLLADILQYDLSDEMRIWEGLLKECKVKASS